MTMERPAASSSSHAEGAMQDELPSFLDDVCRAVARGQIVPEVGVARLLLCGVDSVALGDALRERGAVGVRLAAVLDEHRTVCDRMVAFFREHGPEPVGGAGEESVESTATFFDAAAESSPDAGVALYSLGDAALLTRATNELVTYLEQAGVVGPEHDVLDVGCASGRLLAALAPKVRNLLGVDVSAGMLAEAQRRCAAYANVRLRRTAAQRLAPEPDGAFDLVVAVDSMPYVVHAGPAIVEATFAELARVLRAGAPMYVLNYSYRGDVAADEDELRSLGARFGFRYEGATTDAFSLWDGVVFRLTRH